MKAGWQTKILGDLSDLITKGTTPTSIGHAFVQDGINFIKVESISLTGQFIPDKMAHITSTCHAALRRSQLKDGDILFSIAGALGRTALVTEDILPANTNQALAIIRLKQDNNVLRKFVLKALESGIVLEQIEKFKGGVAQQNLSLAQVSDFKIALPPLPEQKRIVDILDETFEGIATAKANAEKNLQNARALFENHLNSVFTKRGKDWLEKPLAELCERITKGSSPKWQGISYIDAPGILFVTSENIGEYKIMLEQPKYVEERFNTKDKKSILKKGDVLTNIVGASIGRTAVFDRNDLANINQAVCLIRCEPNLLNNYYLTYLLNSPVFKQVLHDNEVNNARANLSLGFFAQLSVPMPPIHKQKEIVTMLDVIREETQHLESIYQQKIAMLDALKKSLLNDAFRGAL